MLNREDYLNFHTDYYTRLEASAASENRYLPYDVYRIPAETAMGPQWLIYHQLAENFIRELLNANNQFFTNIRKLSIWVDILNECPEELRNELIFEIISPLGSYVIGTPYIIKQRYIYAAVMLSHQTQMLQDPGISDTSLNERNININTLRRYSDSFESMSSFIEVLNHIDNGDYIDVTANYRNLYHHRIPPRIEIGLGMTFNRFRNADGSIYYGLGGIQPLRLSEILPALYDQHQACLNTFNLIRALIEEQVSIWERIVPNEINMTNQF